MLEEVPSQGGPKLECPTIILFPSSEVTVYNTHLNLNPPQNFRVNEFGNKVPIESNICMYVKKKKNIAI